MNLLKSIVTISAALTLCMSGTSVWAETPSKHIAITQIVEHPALDAVRQGVKDVLKQNGWNEGENLRWDYQSAQGNVATASQIAKKFAGDQPDAIVAIATPSAQAVAASARNSTIIFSAVTDPVAAKLVKAWDQPGKRITGVSDLTPVDKHLEMMKMILPKLNTIGVIFNPGETNSVVLVDLLKKYADSQSLVVIEAAAPKSADVQTAARSLAGKVDAIYVPTDNTVISAFEGVVKVAEQLDIPLFAGDTDSVKRGAVAALGFNYYEVGLQTGEMLVRVLNGTSPASIPVQGIDKTELYINLQAAKNMNVTIPETMITKAKEVIQ